MLSYYYIISSLPTQFLGRKPSITSAELLNNNLNSIPSSHHCLLKKITLNPSAEIMSINSTLEKWYFWEIALRNALAKKRGLILKRDSSKYLHREPDVFSNIAKYVHDAFAAQNPMDKERILDAARWNELDTLEWNHTFDIEKLLIYKLKLLLCEKWIDREKGITKLDNCIDSIYKNSITAL